MVGIMYNSYTYHHKLSQNTELPGTTTGCSSQKPTNAERIHEAQKGHGLPSSQPFLTITMIPKSSRHKPSNALKALKTSFTLTRNNNAHLLNHTLSRRP